MRASLKDLLPLPSVLTASLACGMALSLSACGDTFSTDYLNPVDAKVDVAQGDEGPDNGSDAGDDAIEPEVNQEVGPTDADVQADTPCVPAAETCNGVDDDCDGEVDEDFTELGAACDGDDAGDCTSGTWVCGSDGAVVCDEAPAMVCDTTNACVTVEAVEDPITCIVTCEETPIAPCCGNGTVESGELCDGECPTNCDDGIACTTDTLSGSVAGCDAACSHVAGTDDGTDTDGDNLTDCQEGTDGSDWTHPGIFNGMLATIGEPPTGFLTSAQCDLFFGDDFGEMYELFDESGQSQNVWQGWGYQAGNTNNYASGDYSFEPNWANSDNTGVHNSFQVLFQAQVMLVGDGTHCFSVDTGAGGIGPGDIAGRRNSCGRVYLDHTNSTVPLAETGYGSNESPTLGCVQAGPGVHDLALAARHYEAHFYSPKFQVRYCFGGTVECVPDQPISQQALRAWGACVPECTGKACGDDGCGGSCGNCGGAETCEDNQCVGSCVPECTGKSCGDDGCGGSCGSCPGAETCDVSGQCVACTPSCGAKVCGDDGCGGSCGSCASGQSCDSAGMCSDLPAVCGDGNLTSGEFCDDGNTSSESPPDASSLPADACLSDCSIDMKACGDGTPDAATGEQCDDGNSDDEDTCDSSCISNDQHIGAACHADGVGADEVDYTAGTIVGCDNVPATFGGCVRACLRSIDPGFSQPLVHNPGGYCTLLAIKCEGGIACSFAPTPGDFDTCTACPAGYTMEEVVTNAAGSTITSRSCLKTCETQADCRWRQWDSRFDEWGQYECLQGKADPSVNICQDVRQY